MDADTLIRFDVVPSPRRTTVTVRIGEVLMGGDCPVIVQTMTNTDTEDPESTARQGGNGPGYREHPTGRPDGP